MRYSLLSPLTFGPGAVLGLSESQVLRRAHARVLEPTGDGFYRAVSPVQFKAGEVIDLHGDLPKCFESQVTLVESPGAPGVSEAPEIIAPKAPPAKKRKT